MHTKRRTGRPRPKSNYELFNCNNLNIRYWSWNYRGCWPLLPGSTLSISSQDCRPSRTFADRGLVFGAPFFIGRD